MSEFDHTKVVTRFKGDVERELKWHQFQIDSIKSSDTTRQGLSELSKRLECITAVVDDLNTKVGTIITEIKQLSDNLNILENKVSNIKVPDPPKKQPVNRATNSSKK